MPVGQYRCGIGLRNIMGLDNVRVILVEPAGPLNVGAIARVMKNMGLADLRLVNPQCDPLGEQARQMAVHAVDLLETAQQFATLPAALVGCDRAVATTARPRELSTPLETPRQVMPWILNSQAGASALIFGREDSGLSNTELNYAQRFLKIPVSPVYESLNLAQAVAVCAYELYQASQNNDAKTVTDLPPRSPHTLAPLEQLEGYYQDLKALLLEIDYLQPHTATARMTKFRSLYNRAQLTPEEVAMLRGILRQMRWARQNVGGGQL